MTITPSFSRMKNNGLYQGTRWQYRWSVPIYADKMIAWVSEEQLADELSEFFREHQFNQGNEPDIQTPFMFNLFGQLGFYPVCIGTDRYELFTPLFDEAVLHLPGHDVRLIRRCAPASARAVSVDGEILSGFSITHAQLTSAGEIVWLP